MFCRYLLFSSVSLLICLGTLRCVASTLPKDEVDALKQIGKTLGKNWNFSVDPCQNDTNSGWITPDLDSGYKNIVTCNCSDASNTICHVTSIVLKQQGLNGTLPPELAFLPELQEIDFTRNYLNGTIPKEWGSMRKLTKISIIGNRLSGEIPEELGNISSLTYLTLETNLLFGSLPSSLGKLVNMDSLMLSSNMFTGELPETLGNLTKLIDFRISDNNFTGRIPDFIQNWRQMGRLDIQASGLQGPIPSGISLLKNLTDLRISDINGTQSEIPKLNNMTGMETLILRNCNISGNYPAFIGENLKNLKSLDLSFNKLVGEIPNFNGKLDNLRYLFLSGNSLTGPLPAWILNKKTTLNRGSLIDLSYNNFTWNSGEPSCVDGINFFRSSSTETNLRGFAPCEKRSTCSQYWDSSHINCGGDEVIINGTTFDGDTNAGGAASLSSKNDKWGFSSTGEFIENQNGPYIASNTSLLTMSNTSLYTKARISPLSLTYYGACFRNGHYDVTLYFAEITFTDEKNYSSLGRRIFDVYIQGKLVLKDFNIKDEASGFGKEVIKKFPADVTSNTLEIRFNWAGKGTTTIPTKGTYGSLISAISVERKRGKKISSAAVIGIVASVVCVIIGVLCILWWKGCLRGKNTRGEDLRGVDLQTGSFTLKQIKAATNNFDVANKLGEGGFGPVYRGELSDGTVIAVKQLSSKSRQGNREFVNEIGMISGLQHPNLVKLHGCCIQGDQLLLVYEYMENNNLARALFGPERFQLKLDWPTRVRICVGIARGLAFLHEESILKIVHRDIKATNVLLDRDLNPKISDFGLAKLDEEENTHISTRIAGTIGYMAPEYALWGYLTHKADVYSFGIVVLEIVSGQNNMSYKEKEDCVCLLHWAFVLHQRERLMELMDPKLGSEFNEEEAARILKVALLCASTSPALRPSMSVVVSMLEGQTVVQDVITDPSIQDDDLRFKVIKEHSQQRQSLSLSQTQPWTGSTSSSNYDLYPNNPSQPLTSSSNEKWMDSSSTSTL